jgi:predicted transcriptional regulator
MAKSLLRIEARKLREQGISVKTIASKLGVSKGSVSLWVRDLVLTVEQLEKLRNNSIVGSERGRLLGSLVQKQRRLKLVEDFEIEGIKFLSKRSKRDLLIAGLALYWGEGCKKRRSVEFCNSDPIMVKFYILWLMESFGIPKNQIWCRVGINQIHAYREEIVRNYWVKVSDVPLSQFNNTSFKRVINNKVYENFEEHYGTLTIKVRKSGQLYYKIMGLIKGMYMAG